MSSPVAVLWLAFWLTLLTAGLLTLYAILHYRRGTKYE